MIPINAPSLKELLQKHLDDEKKERNALKPTGTENLEAELAKLEAEQEVVANFKIQQMNAQADLVRAEKARIDAETAAIKEAQEAAAAEAYSWMEVFTALDERGMEANKIMDAIKSFQDQGHSAGRCLEMIGKTRIKSKPQPPKEPPRPAAYGTWA